MNEVTESNEYQWEEKVRIKYESLKIDYPQVMRL